MESEKKERDYWLTFKGKKISLVKTINSKERYYQGTVIDVFDDKIILDDRKLGEMPISFDNLTLVGVLR